MARRGSPARQPPCHLIVGVVPVERHRPGRWNQAHFGLHPAGGVRRKFPVPSQRPGKQMGPVEPPRGERAGRGSESASGVQNPRRPAQVSGKAATWPRARAPAPGREGCLSSPAALPGVVSARAPLRSWPGWVCVLKRAETHFLTSHSAASAHLCLFPPI